MMFTKISKSQETIKFQTVSQNEFTREVSSSNAPVSTFTPKTNITITPNESEFISINRRRVYCYDEKG